MNYESPNISNIPVQEVSKQKSFTKKDDAGYFYTLVSAAKRHKYLHETPTFEESQQHLKQHGTPWMLVGESTESVSKNDATGSVKLVDEDTGEIVLIYLKKAIPEELVDLAKSCLRKAAYKFRNNARGSASGHIDVTRVKYTPGTMSKFSMKPMKKDGTLSTTQVSNPVNSIAVGWMDRIVNKDKETDTYKMTSWTQQNLERFEKSFPCFDYVSNLYKLAAPELWQKQRDVIGDTPTKIGESVFSSITVNWRYQSATHLDKGDYKGGLGCLFIHNSLEPGQNGGEMLFPEYETAVRLETGDIMLFNPHKWHSTALIAPNNDRITFVCYLREKLVTSRDKNTKNNVVA